MTNRGVARAWYRRAVNYARRSFLGSWALLLACGPSNGEGDGGGTSAASSTGETTAAAASRGGASTGETGGETADPTTAASSGGASADETGSGTTDATTDDTGAMPTSGSLGNGHGVVLVELLRAPDADEDPFVDTARVEVSLLYLGCLIDFYEAEPAWRRDGADGSAVFDSALAEGLCDPASAELVECTVADIVQELEVTSALTVTYEVTGPLEGRRLRFGPLPTLELAACADGGQPIVRVGSNGSVRGVDASGTTVWVTQSFFPAEAATDVGAPISINAVPI